MKKIISAFLILVMLFSVVCVSEAAEEGIYVQADFSSVEALSQYFYAGSFYLDPNGSGIVYGYSEAQAFQGTHSSWSQYDLSAVIAIQDDEMTDYDRHISLVYCNVELQDMGRYEGTYYISFAYDAENKQFTLCGETLSINEENHFMQPVPMELEDGEFYTFGMSVTKGRVRCFLDGELIFDYVDEKNDLLLCYQELPVPIVIWNDGNFVQIKDIKIASPGFLFPFADETSATETSVTEEPENTTTQGGDEPAPTPNDSEKDEDPADTGKPADTGNAPADTNNTGAGNNAPANTNNTGVGNNTPADTNTNKPVGGSSTATGDSTFVVVAAMVAAIGCALIVKKVNAD